MPTHATAKPVSGRSGQEKTLYGGLNRSADLSGREMNLSTKLLPPSSRSHSLRKRLWRMTCRDQLLSSTGHHLLTYPAAEAMAAIVVSKCRFRGVIMSDEKISLKGSPTRITSSWYVIVSYRPEVVGLNPAPATRKAPWPSSEGQGALLCELCKVCLFPGWEKGLAARHDLSNLSFRQGFCAVW